ncbi:MAG: hypothetical protein HY043_22850 [Verrucomicrobia bacterium]|nr:hypothetical protein [Verrucomicrobiota bacterium]
MFSKPVIGPEATTSGQFSPPELSVNSRGPNNPVKEFLAAKSAWLSRTRRQWLDRAGRARPEAPDASSLPVFRNGE